MINKIKQWYYTTGKQQIVYEIHSSFHTFIGVFIGMIVLTPIFNALVGTDLPTFNQFKDFWNVAIDTLARSLWLTLLTQFGLIKYRNKPPVN